MADYDIFNGDADGICALLQLRLAEPRETTLVTGVKRDINLVKKVDASADDEIPADDNLSAHIDTDAETCTGLIVNNYLKGAFLPWAITAAYGDNLHTSAATAAIRFHCQR